MAARIGFKGSRIKISVCGPTVAREHTQDLQSCGRKRYYRQILFLLFQDGALRFHVADWEKSIFRMTC